MIGRLIRCGAVVSLVALSACKGESLLQNLDQAQANEVMAALFRHNVPAQKIGTVRDGYSVEVGRADFAAAVDLLSAYDLPSSKSINVADMFPADSLVASPRAERARLLSAVEQRLQQSVRALNGVVSARVHVAYDLDEAGSPVATASATRISVLVVRDDAASAAGLVSDIKRLLKNSMPNLEYENISVVLTRQSGLQHELPADGHGGAAPVTLYVAAAAALLVVSIGASVVFVLARTGKLPAMPQAGLASFGKRRTRRDKVDARAGEGEAGK
ncbi:type III secretion system inner membrane ring lipoprotein SctJ [Burkholderia semiarida]|uniref:Lipoprotein n=1 Tax=Burkholderia semiarida TaxID=2843303 RepID=A0ABW7LCZ0_9BURK